MCRFVNFLGWSCSLLVISLNAEEISKSAAADYEKYVDEIVRNYAQEMKTRFGLICIGDGGRMPYDVEEIKVIFSVYQRATIVQARRLEVQATERLIQLINCNKKIRPYLREYPFKANRARVSISFNKQDNTRYTDGSVALVLQGKNKIHYFSEDPKTEKLMDLAEEPYEEAFRIVQTGK